MKQPDALSDALADAVLGDDPARALLRHRFFAQLFAKDWAPGQHVKAVYGWVMREHADQAHPGEQQTLADAATKDMAEPEREAWLFGYNFAAREVGA